jgi:hypothetical protein
VPFKFITDVILAMNFVQYPTDMMSHFVGQLLMTFLRFPTDMMSPYCWPVMTFLLTHMGYLNLVPLPESHCLLNAIPNLMVYKWFINCLCYYAIFHLLRDFSLDSHGLPQRSDTSERNAIPNPRVYNWFINRSCLNLCLLLCHSSPASFSLLFALGSGTPAPFPLLFALFGSRGHSCSIY